MNFKFTLTTLLSILFCLNGTMLFSQNPNLEKKDNVQAVTDPNQPVVMTVAELMELQRLEDLRPRRPLRIKKEIEIEEEKSKIASAPKIASSSRPEDLITPRVATPTQAIHSNFLGVLLSETGAFPPDNNGAVGPTQVMIAVNGRIKLFPKAGVTDAPSTTITGTGSTPLANTFSVDVDVFFNPVRESGGFTSDVHVRYDRLSQRWFIVCIDVNPSFFNNRILIAVSSGPTITNESSFTLFQVAHNLIAPAGDANSFFDYPTLGVDKFSLYIGANLFNAAGTAFLGCNMYVINKADLIKASPVLTATAFRNSAAVNDMFTPQGVDNDDPDATEGYFIGVSNTLFSKLIVKRITYSGGVPTISADLGITVATTQFARTVPYKGSSTTSIRLDGLDDRLYAAMIMKNKITGGSTLWTAHSFNVTALGVASGTSNRNASRWYEIGNLTATPSVIQFGTMFDNTTTNPKNYWIPGIAGTGQGHMGMITHGAGVNDYPNVVVAGRYSSDATGTLQAPVFATTATSNYNPADGSPHRWGDYAQMVVDPDDNMTLWGFAQYANDLNTYGVRAVQLKAPAPPQSFVANLPEAGNCGSNVSLTIVGTVGSGTSEGFFDPGVGYNKRLAASITSPSAITVNSVTFTSATQMTAKLNTTGKSAGSYTLKITNPDGQTTTGKFSLADCLCSGGTVTPSVSIAVTTGTNPTCSGTSVTFTAIPTNGGTNPTYQWKKGGTNVGMGGSTYTDAGTTGGVITCEMTIGTGVTCPSSNTATSTGISLTVNPLVTPSVSIEVTSGSNPTCSGTSVTFTATPTNGGTNPTYQWKKGGSNVGIGGSTYTDAGTTGGVISCVMTIGTGVTCPSSNTATSMGITLTINPLLTPSVTIAVTGGTNPTCSGTSVTFTATPTNQGKNATYQWKKGGTNVGVGGTTYTDAGTTGGVITCVMTIGGDVTCATTNNATSTGITLTVNPSSTPSVSIAVTGGMNPTCSGSSVTFTATPTNGGTNPTYQWKKGGTNVGVGGTTYTDAGTIGGVITCVMTSGTEITCPTTNTATSTGITLTINLSSTPSVSIAITDGTNPTCSGSSVTFTATPTNGGTNPTYQWKKGGTNVGTGGPTYTDAGISSGIITCEMTIGTGVVCPTTITAVSTDISLVISTVSISISSITNVTCNNGNNGQVVVLATGGTGAKTYTISPNIGTQSPTGTFNGLTAQTYIFTATDVNGCKSTTTANVTQPPAIVITPSIMNVRCFGQSSGSIAVSVSGGVGAVNYTISPNPNSKNPTSPYYGLMAGTYVFTATDANGCTNTQAAIVTQPPAIVLSRPVVTNATCFGQNNGKIVVSATGGMGAITLGLEPNNGVQSPVGTFSGLAPLSYMVIATDANNCSAEIFAFVSAGSCDPLESSMLVTKLITSKSGIEEMALYPNPVTGILNIQIKTETEGKGQIVILDITGKQMLSKNQIFEKGINYSSLDVSLLNTGVYLVQYIDALQNRLSLRVVKN